MVDVWLKGDATKRKRRLQGKSARRLKKMLSLMSRMDGKVGEVLEGVEPSFLELASMGETSLKQYLATLAGFCACGPISKAELRDQERMDDRVVNWMNAEFARGSDAWKGEKVVAAIVALAPQYSKHGSYRIPKSMRCLKGWRRLCPGRSKKPHGWPVWKAIAVERARLGSVRAGIFTLVMVAAYLRIRELLSLTVASLMAPTNQGVRYWTLLLFPAEFEERSKTGQADDTIALDCEAIQFLNPCFAQLARQDPTESLLGMAYLDFYRLFMKVSLTLGLPTRPSEGRHSGPSIDRAMKTRTPEEVRRLGRWAALKSVGRYEKSGRLNQTWTALTEKQQQHCLRCEKGVEQALLHGVFPLAFEHSVGSAANPGITSHCSGSNVKSTRVAAASTGGAASVRRNTSASTGAVGREKHRSTRTLSAKR
jgi:hypothetical protein